MSFKLAYDYQPELLINSRVGNTLGDFDIPGDNKIPNPLRITKPWQTVGTTNNSWGFKSYDNDWKSLVSFFLAGEIVAKGELHVKYWSDGMGDVPETSVNNLIALGDWLKINGEGVYNTKRWHVTHEGQPRL